MNHNARLNSVYLNLKCKAEGIKVVVLMTNRNTMENSKTVSVLNDLLHIVNDRMEGYASVEGKIWEKDHKLQDNYEHFISQSNVMKNDLINLITKLGGNANDSSSVSGTLHRAWIDVKNSFIVGNLEESTLQNVIFGEEAAIKSYRDALETGELDSESTALVEDQLKKITDSYNEFKGIYENYKA